MLCCVELCVVELCVVCVVLFDIQVPRIYGSGKGKSIVRNNGTILFMQEWPWPMLSFAFISHHMTDINPE